MLYDSALESMYVIEKVPAWSGGQLSRMISTPKRYLIEPALMEPLLTLPALTDGDSSVAGRLMPHRPTGQACAVAPKRIDACAGEFRLTGPLLRLSLHVQ